MQDGTFYYFQFVSTADKSTLYDVMYQTKGLNFVYPILIFYNKPLIINMLSIPFIFSLYAIKSMMF